MAKGNEIVVSANPRGVFQEGTINGALKPGVQVQIDVSAGLDANGRPTWEAYAPGTDGLRSGVTAVLLPDTLQGQLATTAYADGAHCFVYIPAAGDELNVLAGTLAGGTFGEVLIADSGTGAFITTTGTPETEPFQTLEAGTSDTLVHVVATGV